MSLPPEERVRVDLAGAPYEIVIGTHLLPRIGRFAQELGLGGQVLVVTDDQVAPLYLSHVVDSLRSHGFTTSPPGGCRASQHPRPLRQYGG